MIISRRWFCWLLVICGGGFSHAKVTRGDEPIPVGLIYDTDIGGDIDDALGLGVIHALVARGESRLLAVTLTQDHPQAGPLTEAINTFYGAGEVPIGAATNKIVQVSQYIELPGLRDGDRLRYPHRSTSSADFPDAVSLLRKTLAAQPDGSVIIAQVGMSSNLAGLLATGGDAVSPLSGRELAAKKVKLLSLMAGAFTPIDNNPRYVEWNVKLDIPSARKVAADWPGPVVYSGFEIGIAAPYPARSIERDFGYVRHHPLAEGYRMWGQMPYDRPTWDLTSVLHAVRPDHGYFELSAPGKVTVDEAGVTEFAPTADGQHRYLILRKEAIARVQEALTQLTSQPPR